MEIGKIILMSGTETHEVYMKAVDWIFECYTKSLLIIKHRISIPFQI